MSNEFKKHGVKTDHELKPKEVVIPTQAEINEYLKLMSPRGMRELQASCESVMRTYMYNMSSDALDETINGRDAETNQFMINNLGTGEMYMTERAEVVRKLQLIIKVLTAINNSKNGEHDEVLEQWKSLLSEVESKAPALW